MLELRTEMQGSTAVVTVSGRFDSAGAAAFDNGMTTGAGECRSAVLNLGGVGFLSSAGVRSLLKLEQALRARGGSIVLVDMQPLVAQVLDLSGLLGQLRQAASVGEALALAGSIAAPEQPHELFLGGRSYEVTTLCGVAARLEWWGSRMSRTTDACRPDEFTCLTMAELGLAFGTGGLGGNREEAATAQGPFLAAGNLAVVHPHGAGELPDYQLSPRPADSTFHVARAVSIAGPARLVAALPACGTSLADLAEDLIALVEQQDGHRPGQLAMLIVAELAGPHAPGPADAGAEDASDNRVPGAAPAQWVVALGTVAPTFSGVGALLAAAPPLADTASAEPRLEQIVDTERLAGVVELDPEARLGRGRVWVYHTTTTVPGVDKLLEICPDPNTPMLDEWRLITRRIYTDTRRVELKTLTGGYNATTFRVTSYDHNDRRMIPTILKISSIPFTDREERAHHEYVKKFILNNSTVIMGRATQGAWAGLRYNFVGITGADSALSWLAEHYQRRPASELTPLFDQLFGKILWPWFGQPRQEPVRPWEDHDPFGLFPTLLQEAEHSTGIRVDSETIDAPELGFTLPNPYRFLARVLPAHRADEVLFNSTITHGDLNLNNVLLDERDNVYVIDFSETRPRAVTADFARLEPLLALELTRLGGTDDLAALARFFAALLDVRSLAERPRLEYTGDDPMVHKAYEVICLLRRHAAAAAAPFSSMLPYLLALFEWTVVIVAFRQVSEARRRLSMLCAGLICKRISALDSEVRQ